MDPNGTPSLAARVAGAVPAAALGALSALRGRRVFHPVGVAYSASCRVPETRSDRQLLPSGEHDAVVRFSRGAGLPIALPDLLGVAVKLRRLGEAGGDQDLLLVSSAGPPLARRLLIARQGFVGRRFSSILAYRFREGPPMVIGARVTGADSRLDSYEQSPYAPVATVHLEAASRLGDWEPVATIELGERLPPSESDGLRFDPWNASADLRPTGVLNAVRGPAYTVSQAVRRRLGWREADAEPSSIQRIEIEPSDS